MNQDNRWTIDELIARYELEPELLDVFVEGTFDKELLVRASSKTPEVRAFYEIDSVDVPVTLLVKYGLTEGNKQRVIALSREFSTLPDGAKVICKVDRDLDHWFGALEESKHLRWSSYCSIENHFLTTDIIKDIALTAARAKITHFSQFCDSFHHVLRQLFALRLAERQLGLAATWISLRKYLRATNGIVVFDIGKYTTALLTSNSKGTQGKTFRAAVDTWMQRLSADIRLEARGHDYTMLLAWAIAQFSGQKELASEIAIERLFVLIAPSLATLQSELH